MLRPGFVGMRGERSYEYGMQIRSTTPPPPGHLTRYPCSTGWYPNVTVFEVDPVTRLRLDKIPLNTATLTDQLWGFNDSVLDDHATEVLLAHD